MLCPRCDRRMRPLFTSYACDWCDGLESMTCERGYIVLRDDSELASRPMYVFRTRTDAAIWRSAHGMQHCPIREIMTEWPIRWRTSSGLIQGVELADRPFIIFADHRFPPAPYRGFLTPESERSAA